MNTDTSTVSQNYITSVHCLTSVIDIIRLLPCQLLNLRAGTRPLLLRQQSAHFECIQCILIGMIFPSCSFHFYLSAWQPLCKFQHSISPIILIHSFTKYLLSIFSVPDTDIGSGDLLVNKILALMELIIQKRRQMINKQICNVVGKCYVESQELESDQVDRVVITFYQNYHILSET